MRIGIHPDKIGNESYSDKWGKYLLERNVEVEIVNLLALDFIKSVNRFDGIMCRWSHNSYDKQSIQKILYTIETYLDIPVFPNTKTSWHFDEKIHQYYLLSAVEAPSIKTWLFWNFDEAIEWVKSAELPLVFKLSSGAGSSNVILINTRREAVRYIEKMFDKGVYPYSINDFNQAGTPGYKTLLKNLLKKLRFSTKTILVKKKKFPYGFFKPEIGFVYFQEFLKDNDFDTRVTIIGNRAFAFRRFNRPHDFRASGSGLIDHDPSGVDLRCVKLAFQISERCEFQSMAYDFLYKSGEPLICEISYAFTDKAVQACPGHWDRDLNWMEGHLWPEEAQAEDFLKLIINRNKTKQ